MALVGLLPAVAESQVRVPKWEIEFHGSFATSFNSISGLDQTPPAGPTFTMGDGSTTTREVHSWFFGSGASLLNQVLGLRGVSQRLTALDANGWPIAGYRPGPQVGARLARRVTNAIWIEFSVDLNLDPLGFDGDADNRIEATRASFESAFVALNNSTATLMPNPTITSTANVVSGGRRLSTTGVVQLRSSGQGIRTFLLGGAGFATPVGGGASLELVGRYQLTTPGGTLLDETDAVTLRYETGPSFLIVAGFGFMKDLSPRSGWRVETRVTFGRTELDAFLTTKPTITVTTPTGAVILNATNPGLQFASNGLRTNLSALPVSDFPVLDASGRTIQWVVSGGYYRRF